MAMTRFNVPRGTLRSASILCPVGEANQPAAGFSVLSSATAEIGTCATRRRESPCERSASQRAESLGRRRQTPWLRISARSSTMGRLSKATHSMSLFDKNTLRILFTVLATASLLALVWLARKPLLAFLFAMLFAYLLEPLIALLQKWTHCNRGIRHRRCLRCHCCGSVNRGSGGRAARGGGGTASFRGRT